MDAPEEDENSQDAEFGAVASVMLNPMGQQNP